MRLMGFVFVLFMLFPGVSNADIVKTSYYIKVGIATNAEKLEDVKSMLKYKRIKTVVKTLKTKHIIYAGPYKDSKSARDDLKRIKEDFPSARVVKAKARIKQVEQYR